jgi:hypothetical protein
MRGNEMKNIFVWTIAAVLVVGTACIAKAQNASDNGMQNDHSDVRTLTGCLQSNGGNEYKLLAQNGSTWEIRSDSVDLASHVGQTVTVTGAVNNSAMHNMKEDAKQEAQEHGMDKSGTEHGHLTVTKVRMVSHSCS